jgi:hypothetical protein
MYKRTLTGISIKPVLDFPSKFDLKYYLTSVIYNE